MTSITKIAVTHLAVCPSDELADSLVLLPISMAVLPATTIRQAKG